MRRLLGGRRAHLLGPARIVEEEDLNTALGNSSPLGTRPRNWIVRSKSRPKSPTCFRRLRMRCLPSYFPAAVAVRCPFRQSLRKSDSLTTPANPSGAAPIPIH